MQSSNTSSNMTNSLEYLTNNKIISAMIGLFLALYAALAAPKLPKSITLWFDNFWFKLGFMFLIAYMSTKDAPIAIISAVALLVTLQTLSAHKTTDRVIQAFQSQNKNEDKINQAFELPLAQPPLVLKQSVDEQVDEEQVDEEQVVEEQVGEEPLGKEPVGEQNILTCKEVMSSMGEKTSDCCDNLDDLIGYDLDQYATF
jgi:hypothetical protein